MVDLKNTDVYKVEKLWTPTTRNHSFGAGRAEIASTAAEQVEQGDSLPLEAVERPHFFGHFPRLDFHVEQLGEWRLLQEAARLEVFSNKTHQVTLQYNSWVRQKRA
jgi:hypothetical protein